MANPSTDNTLFANQGTPNPRFPAAAASLSERQRIFAASILDPTLLVPIDIAESNSRRFGIYRNNVVAGLIEALRCAFPVVERLVGAPFFAAMARIYVAQEPPTSPIMLEYGAGFPDFIAVFGPANDVPYLSDIARLERAWAETYHAAEAAPALPVNFGEGAQTLSHITLALHPSLRIVRSAYPIVTIWHMHAPGGVPQPTCIDGAAENALLIRPEADVEVRRAKPGAAIFLSHLMAKSDLASAASAALQADPAFDLVTALRELNDIGAVTAWNVEANAACHEAAGLA